MRDLYLMRHAKSAYPAGVGDHDRPLSERGRANAEVAAAWFAARPIDAVLCSTALRTRQTLDALGLDAAATFDERLYGAGPGTITSLVAAVPESAESVLVVAHFPGIPDTVLNLARGGHAPDAEYRFFPDGYKTAAITHLRWDGTWADAHAPGIADFVEFVVPR